MDIDYLKLRRRFVVATLVLDHPPYSSLLASWDSSTKLRLLRSDFGLLGLKSVRSRSKYLQIREIEGHRRTSLRPAKHSPTPKSVMSLNNDIEIKVEV